MFFPFIDALARYQAELDHPATIKRLQMTTNQSNRVAIYARYSTDLQNDRSIEDQFVVCESYAARNGLNVTETFADRAASGASMVGRDQYALLVQEAEKGSFDINLAEDLDP